MATLQSSEFRTTDDSLVYSKGYLVSDYTTTTSDTQYTISGTITLWLYVAWPISAITYTAVTSGINVTCPGGNIVKNLTDKTLTLSNTTDISKRISVSLGSFSITIPRTKAQTSYTFSIGSNMRLTRSLGGYYEDGSVSGSAAIAVNPLPTYQITYNANSGEGAPAAQTKWYGDTITLSSSFPIKSGYTFKGWATSTSNAASGTVNYASGASYSSNAALTLYAVWELAYSKPILTGLSVERCNSSGTYQDDGTYAKVVFDWSVFRTANARYYGGSTYPYSSNSVSNCTITIGTVTSTPSLSGASGAKTQVVGSGTFDNSTQYSVSVSITDSQSIVSAHTTTITGVLAVTNYPLDVSQNGTAVGILRAAPDSGTGLFVGDSVDIISGSKYKIGGTNLAASDVGAVPTSRTVNSKALSSNISLTASDVSALPLSGGTLTGTLKFTENSVEANFRPANADYYSTISHLTSGNEATVFATKNAVTSFMFVNGEDSVTNHASNRWQSLTPALQIKNNKIAIGKLIANGVTPTYALDVNGTVNATSFEGSGSNLTGVVHTETDPTVPSWAKASSKPSYTASEVGAVPTSRTVNGHALTGNVAVTTSDLSIDDYVTYTSNNNGNGWYVTRWASGKEEAWGTASTGTLTMSASGSLYRATGKAITIPNGVLSNTPTFVDITAMYNNAVFVNAVGTASSKISLSVQIWKSTNATAAVDLKIHTIYYPSTY